MPDAPWTGDACSLVDAFRAGERSPVEELEATLSAVASSELNCFSHLDPEAAAVTAAAADVSLPFGGVPAGVKQLQAVRGWPETEASLVFAGDVAEHDSTLSRRMRAAGLVLFGATTASEFGGLSIGVTKENGITRNPWDPTRTTGGSSAGSAGAVAGGLCTLGSGGDGGGSIRKPAGYCGLPGFKGTFGIIPRGPRLRPAASTVCLGVMARSVRDIARFLDCTNGNDERDPYSWPRREGWEAGLGTNDLDGLTVAIDPTLGGSVVVLEDVQAVVYEVGEALAAAAGWKRVDADVAFPGLSLAWAMAGLAEVRADLGERWPDCKEQMTFEMAFGMDMTATFDHQALAQVETDRMKGFEAMAEVFDQVDLLITATNPDVAPPAEATVVFTVGDEQVELGNDGGLTIPANMAGNPAVSLPGGAVGGRPVGVQVIARHHADGLLLDVARLAERARPWALVAPGSPR